MNDSLSDTIVAKSDQLNADDLVGGPITVTVTEVKRTGSKDQPVAISITGEHQPYKPNLTMRRLLIAGWGDRGAEWVGKSMTIYRNPNVKWGGKCVGGLEVSHMSHIESAFELSLAVTRGKKKVYRVELLNQVKASDTKPELTEIDQQWIDYCRADKSKLSEIEDTTYRAKIEALL